MDQFSGYDNEDQEADRVILNVGGLRFETYVTTLQNIADTRLAWIIENVEEETLKDREFFFDRHPGAFVHILNFYRTGKLHTPTDMCGPAFEEELQFWGIDEKQMEPCCWEMFTKHREAELNLRTFEGPGFEDLQVLRTRKYSNFSTYEEEGCIKTNMKSMWALLNDPHSSELAKRFSLLSCGMIIISLSIYCLLTMPSLKNDTILQWINKVCLTFFTIEFILRVVVCPRKLQFVKDYKNWIDFLSIIPSYLMIAFPNKEWINNLVIIRLLRVFKFFKLSYGLQVLLHTLKASSYELTLLLLILLIPLVVFSSLVYAFEHGMSPAGQTDFDSIPRTFWWAIVTMTTVGYGDLAPKTWPGQIIGSVCAIISVLIIALPISVIGNNFNLYYAHVRARLKLPQKNRHLLQGRLRGLLRQPAMLSSRDRDRKNITRRNGGGAAGSVHRTVGGCGAGGRLTIEHAHSTSPFLQLQRRGGASGLEDSPPFVDDTSVEVSLLDNEDEGQEITQLINEKEKLSTSAASSRRDVLNVSVNNQQVEGDENHDEDEKILQDFLAPKKSEQTPLMNRMNEKNYFEQQNHHSKGSGRRRRNFIQEDALNGSPTRQRRAAVGIPSERSLEESLSSSGSNGSIILPSISLGHTNPYTHDFGSLDNNERGESSEDEERVQQQTSQQDNKLLSGVCEDNLIRRESMRKMFQCDEPPAVTAPPNNTPVSKARRLRSHTVDNWAAAQSARAPSLKRQRPLLDATSTPCLQSTNSLDFKSLLKRPINNNNNNNNNNNGVEAGFSPRKYSSEGESNQRKNSHGRDPQRKFSNNNRGGEPQKKTSLVFKKKTLRRSNTDNCFIGSKTQGGEPLHKHSLSIDDIIRTSKHGGDSRGTAQFLRESGV